MCSTRYGCLYFLNEHDCDTKFTTVKYKLYIFFYNFGSSSEIPQFRLPYDVVNFELELVKDLGVKVSIFFLSLFMIVCNVVNLKHKKCLFLECKSARTPLVQLSETISSHICFQVECGKPLSTNHGLTLQSLQEDGYKAVFLGIGDGYFLA